LAEVFRHGDGDLHPPSGNRNLKVVQALHRYLDAPIARIIDPANVPEDGRSGVAPFDLGGEARPPEAA
jgi:hypothetical protein